MSSDVVPEALLFDMDGLLLDTERIGCLAFIDIVTPLGKTADEADRFYRALVGTSGQTTRQRVADWIAGLDIDAFIASWHDRVEHHMSDGVPLMPTVPEVIPHLAGQGRKMAVVTSTGSARARHHLEGAGLLTHFADVIGGDVVTANKPDPAPYLEASRRLGVDPNRCIAFEDSDRGVEAAARAGCVTVQIPDLRPDDRAFPDFGQHIAADLASALRHFHLI